MINFNKQLLPLILSMGIIQVFSLVSFAEDRDIKNYHPSVLGQYAQIRLLPQDALITPPPANCNIGTFYTDPSGNLKYCHKDPVNIGQGEWGNISFIWAQSGDNLYLSNTSIYPQVKLGISTATPEFKLTLNTDPGILALGTFGRGATLPNNLGVNSRLIWYPRKAAFRAGYVAGAQWENANIGDYSTALGRNTQASGNFSVIVGGDGNTVSATHTIIGGGVNNSVSGNFSAIAGGLDNFISSTHTMIWGGRDNRATANYTTIAGGNSNRATASTVAVGGGNNNQATTPFSVIHGGQNNTADYVGNGQATGYTTIGGGSNNRTRHNYTTISGGDSNTANESYATIGGGQSNTASGQYSTVAGGRENTASGDYAIVTGGYQNTASGHHAIIGGGERNTASGHHAMILGGTDNLAAGNYSWANGRNVRIANSADRTFAWGYSDDNTRRISITASDAFIIAPGRLSGSDWNPKVGIRDSDPGAVLEINHDSNISAGFRPEKYFKITKITNSAGNTENVLAISLVGDPTLGIAHHSFIGVGRNADVANLSYYMQFGNANNAYLSYTGQWVPASSKKYKEKIIPLTSSEAETTLDHLNPVTFQYHPTANVTNAGFIAEDVPNLVAMKDHNALTNTDFIAILTKTIQDQDAEIKKQNFKIEAIRKKIAELKAKLEN